MLFRSKTAIFVRFQKVFKAEESSQSFSKHFKNDKAIVSVKTHKFSAVLTKLSLSIDSKTTTTQYCSSANSQQSFHYWEIISPWIPWDEKCLAMCRNKTLKSILWKVTCRTAIAPLNRGQKTLKKILTYFAIILPT